MYYNGAKPQLVILKIDEIVERFKNKLIEGVKP